MTSKNYFEEITIYECPNCLNIHETNDEALDCCRKVYARNGYRCSRCKTPFDDKSFAINCCEDIKKQYSNN